MERNEIDMCKELGERYGYGHLMSVMSSLWRKSLSEKGGDDMKLGAFVPTISTFIRDEDGLRESAENTAKLYDSLIESHFTAKSDTESEERISKSEETKRTAELFKKFYDSQQKS